MLEKIVLQRIRCRIKLGKSSPEMSLRFHSLAQQVAGPLSHCCIDVANMLMSAFLLLFLCQVPHTRQGSHPATAMILKTALTGAWAQCRCNPAAVSQFRSATQGSHHALHRY